MDNVYSYSGGRFSLSHTITPQPDPSRFFLHTHSKAELYYFVRGCGTFHIEGSAYPLESGDLLLMQGAESHYIELDPSQPYERKVLHFDPDLLLPIDPQGKLLRPFFQRTPGKGNLYKAHLFQSGSSEHYLNTMMSEDPEISLYAGLIPLLYELCRIRDSVNIEDQVADTTEYRIMRYLNQNIEKPITLQDICQKFYISKSQLCRAFRSCTGVTVKHYLTIKRLIRAKQLLQAGEPATQVYLKCGFNDYSSFYRAYTKHYGHAPTKG